MADKETKNEFYAETPAGNVRKTSDPEQAERLRREGRRFVSSDEAADRYRQEQEIKHVDETYGPGMKAGMGLLQGATLGLGGPAIAEVLGSIDPAMKQSALADLRGLEGDSLYSAGNLAGIVAPMALGGEGLLGLTPAGAAGRLGTMAEEVFAKRALPEAASALGKVSGKFLSAGIRGGVETGAMGLGQHISEAVIHDHDLTWQSAAAATADGALMGFLLGGSIGGAGEALGQASRAVKGSGSLLGEGPVYRQLGITSEADQAALRKAASLKGDVGPADAIKRFHEEKLAADGRGLNRSPSELRTMAKEWGSDQAKIVKDGIETLQKEAASSVPSLERVYARLDQELALPVMGTAEEKETLSAIKSIKSKLKPIEPSVSTFPQAEGAPTATPSTWKQWFESRDQIYEATKGLSDSLKGRVLTVIDSELNNAVEAAAAQIGRKGLAEQLQAAVAGQRLADVFESLSGSKVASELVSKQPLATPPEIGAVAGSAAMGHPIAGAGFLAAKMVQRLLHPTVEPWMAEMAYRGTIGAKAAAAVPTIKSQIRSKIKTFFKAAEKGTAATYVQNVPKSRKEYESHLEKVSQLLSPAHQERVMQYAKELNELGQNKLAEAAVLSYMKAKAYLSWNMPEGGLSKMDGVLSLRPEPKKASMDAKEWKFLFQSKIAMDPMSLLDKIADGSVTSDEVQVMKYIYPKLHEEVVTAASEEIIAMKQAGKYMDYNKIQTLGIALNAAIDFFQEGENVAQIQAALQIPENQPQAQGQQQPATSATINNTLNSGLLTPTEQVSIGIP